MVQTTQEVLERTKALLEEKWEADKSFSLKFIVENGYSMEDIEFLDLRIDSVSDEEYESEYSRYTFLLRIDEKNIGVDYLVNNDLEHEIPNDFFPNGRYKLHADNEFGTNGRDVYYYDKEDPEYQVEYSAADLFNELLSEEVEEELYDLLVSAKKEKVKVDDKLFYEKHQSILPGVASITGTHSGTVTLHFSSGINVRAEKHDIEFGLLKSKNDEERAEITI